MRSIRSRLTVWNAGIITIVLLAFAGAAYAMLRDAAIEQVDQTVRQELDAVVRTLASTRVPSVAREAALEALAIELRARGFKTVVTPDASALVVRALRSGRGEIELRDEFPSQAASADTLTAELRRAIAAQSASPRHDVSRAAFTVGGASNIHVVQLDTTFGGRPLALVATEPLDEVGELLDQVRVMLLIALPVVAIIGLLVGYGQARNALAPVATMTQQARQLGARNLHERLAVENVDDELGQLAITFNDVLDRIERAMRQQRQFTADASHELRTPLAIIRSEADVTLDGGERTAGEYRESLTTIRDGSEQMSKIVNDLFLLARADAGETLPRPGLLYVDELILDTVRSMRAIAVSRGITVDVVAPGGVAYAGDEALLRQALVNLLDNAIKYAGERTTVRVSLDSLDRALRIAVADEGPGIPDGDKPFVFDRFYRVSETRGTHMSAFGAGAGLGLAIARDIVELHGGTLTLRDTHPDLHSGATFEVLLPTG